MPQMSQNNYLGERIISKSFRASETHLCGEYLPFDTNKVWNKWTGIIRVDTLQFGEV